MARALWSVTKVHGETSPGAATTGSSQPQSHPSPSVGAFVRMRKATGETRFQSQSLSKKNVNSCRL